MAPHRTYKQKIRALMQSMGLTQAQLAQILGSTQPSVSRWASGIRPDPDWADKIDELWGAKHPEGRLSRVHVPFVSVMGKVGAGAEIDTQFEQQGVEGLYEIEFSISKDDMIAFEVVGNSMWPRYGQDDIIVCGRSGSPPASLIGMEAAIKLENGRRYVKRIRRGSSPDLFFLESFNAEPIENARIEWASEISHVVRKGHYEQITFGDIGD